MKKAAKKAIIIPFQCLTMLALSYASIDTDNIWILLLDVMCIMYTLVALTMELLIVEEDR